LSGKNIKVDPACQARASTNAKTVNDYVEIMEEEGDDNFPPVAVFHDGTDYWLSDGFHRHAAAKKARLHSLKAEVRQGSRRDAILHAVGANATHGLRRSNADKRRAVTILLEDDVWSTWSNREIARRCGVDEGLVRKLKDEHGSSSASADNPQIDRKVERKGTVFEMKTGNIGKRDGLEELLAIEPDRDAEPPQEWLVAPESPAADRSATEPSRDERQPAPNPASSDEVHLNELMSAWARASGEIRQQFLANIGALIPQAEAGPAPNDPKPPQEPAPAETEEPSPTDPQENRLMEIWKDLKSNPQWYGRMWVEAGCPSEYHPSEGPHITERLVH
jgi:hypothetical protein